MEGPDGLEQMKYFLVDGERKKLHSRALAAQKDGQQEVCGILLVNEKGRIWLRFIPNASDEPLHYKMGYRDVKAEVSRALQLGLEVLGSFHSHPIGYAEPGKSDFARGFLRRHMLIYDVCGRSLKLWKKIKKQGEWRAMELPLYVSKARRLTLVSKPIRFRARNSTPAHVIEGVSGCVAEGS